MLNVVKLLNTKTLILYPHFDPDPFQWLDEPKDPVGPIPPISSRWSSSAAHLTLSHKAPVYHQDEASTVNYCWQD